MGHGYEYFYTPHAEYFYTPHANGARYIQVS